MIHVILRGRLGNHLFMYAAGRALALRHNTALTLYAYPFQADGPERVSSTIQLLDQFNLKATVSRERLWVHPKHRPFAYLCRLFGRRRTCRYERAWGFQPDILSAPDESCLHGFFQSERYFKDIAPLLRSELSWKFPPTADGAAQLEAYIRSVEAVSLHVRRTDYLKGKFNVCTLGYYRRAVAFLQKNVPEPRFFVFSDDLKWCKDNLNRDLFGTSPFDFVALPDTPVGPARDLRLMSRCRHHIIANSTFSWWGAWLNPDPDKIVVAPGRWFNDAGMNPAAVRYTIPSEWHRIEV